MALRGGILPISNSPVRAYNHPPRSPGFDLRTNSNVLSNLENLESPIVRYYRSGGSSSSGGKDFYYICDIRLKDSSLNLDMYKLVDFRQLLEETFGLLPNMKNLIIDWVQEGFKDFFGKLDELFHLLSGKYALVSRRSAEGLQGDKVLSGVVLVIAQLSLFVEQNVVPRITEASGS
ncbi:hypothetical protein POM88_001005 [Heracleum sosnowskyi]|uniref:Uncharacterized protein n=1 Tax=Heracleum sosnowskyi TaxID=360622 RepID=A0AAD8N4L7_9APIA|nr:hypothetical protein POM88_001005 [Heracleum sosnowskyi]